MTNDFMGIQKLGLRRNNSHFNTNWGLSSILWVFGKGLRAPLPNGRGSDSTLRMPYKSEPRPLGSGAFIIRAGVIHAHPQPD